PSRDSPASARAEERPHPAVASRPGPRFHGGNGLDFSARRRYGTAVTGQPTEGEAMGSTEPQVGHDRDTADLARFGYKQELKRTLGVFSSFAVAFSYISPSTGIFTLYFLALSIGGVMFWTWPVVAFGQLLIALNWAELSSHYPIAGSVFQWTKYLSGR